MTTRLYQAEPLAPQTTLKLDANASHHLARVLRAAVGDTLIVFNGSGGEYTATITHIDKKNVSVDIGSYIDRDVESPITIYLAQGIARGEKMDTIIQKAVELGANKIYPLITERCNVHLKGDRETKRFQHWESIVISAAEQSGRCRIPEIAKPQSLNAWLEQIKADACYVLSPHVKTKLPSTTDQPPTRIALLIGPEGGLSEQEILAAQQKNFLPLNLGPRVLRTETATIAAITTLQWHFGDFQH